MSRTHFTAADLDRISCNIKNFETVITFRNEQLLNLWINEMQGQISDGMWENSRRTEWLWRNVLYRIGPETKVEVANPWNIGKKSYPLVKELWDVIGYRLYGPKDETTAGYQTEKEVRAAWRELNLAIYNATTLPIDSELRTQRKRAEVEHNALVKSLREQAGQEKETVVGNVYGIYLDPENSRTYRSLDIGLSTSSDKPSYYFTIGKSFLVPAGKLAAAIEELRKLYKTSENFKIV